MPAWYTSSSWVLGELASEDDGSLRPAAMVELYLHGRNDFANGLLANSPARTFAEAAEAAVARVHADHTGNAAARKRPAAPGVQLIALLSRAQVSSKGERAM